LVPGRKRPAAASQKQALAKNTSATLRFAL
jgi:hypothetical protein